MKVTVLGSGGWGTALALLLQKNGHDVTLWSFLQSECENLKANRENPMLKGVALPEELALTWDLACVRESDAVVLATPSFAVRETAKKIAGLLAPQAVVITVAKGIENGTFLRLSQVVQEEIGDTHPVVVLCGPTHAEEVGRGVPSAIVASSRDRAAAELTQDLFMNQVFRVYTNDDVVGAEIGGALKNVIALCVGISDGLGFGDNTRAMLMTRGLTEIARLGVAMGGKQATFAGLTGVGDLIVTCTSMHSRNHRAGILIGEGVEGYYAAATAKAMADRFGVSMPIVQAAYRVLYEGVSPREMTRDLMTRQRTHETEDAWV